MTSFTGEEASGLVTGVGMRGAAVAWTPDPDAKSGDEGSEEGASAP